MPGQEPTGPAPEPEFAKLKQVEAQLRRMTKVFMDGADPILIRDLDGCVLDVNCETERVFGWTREELQGGRTQHLLTPEGREQGDEVLRLLQRGETVRNAEFAVRAKSGLVIPVLVTAFALTDENDRPVAYAEIIKDVTPLRRAAAELEQRGRELRQFTNILVHDLEAPLRSIRTFAGLLREHLGGQADRETAEYLEFITAGADRMSGLIRDLLDFARLQHTPKGLAPVDCAKAFAQAVGNLHAAIAEAGARVTSGPLPTVRGDEGQLVRLLQNLIGNAVKYRGGAPPEVHVSCQRAGDDWHFSVRDNGIGIDPEYLPKVFDAFYRLHSHDKIPGSGLGLAACKLIVERYGGRLWAESTAGQGSVFHFTIPA